MTSVTFYQLALSDLHLSAGDNGNVYDFTDGIDALNRPGRPIGSEVFAYDALNRLRQFTTTGTSCAAASNGKTMNSGNSYVIDAWGNLTQKNAPIPPSSPLTGCVAETLQESVDAHNRFTPGDPAIPSDPPARYDAAGNMIANGTYTYDAENRLVKLSGDLNPRYLYDGDGNRVAKTPTNTLYWQNAGGEILAESTGSTLTAEYIFFGSRRIARIDNPSTYNASAVRYYISDHLGSATVIANPAGASVCETMYYPYGGERWSSCTDANHYKFTGKERDGETGLDYFGARYYGSTMGRWMSPDPITVTDDRMVDPQGLNLYVYMRNRPINGIDPDGQYEAWIHSAITSELLKMAVREGSVSLSDENIETIADRAGDAPGGADSPEYASTNPLNWPNPLTWALHFATAGQVNAAADRLTGDIDNSNWRQAGFDYHAIEDALGGHHLWNGLGPLGGIGHVIQTTLSPLGICKNPDKLPKTLDKHLIDVFQKAWRGQKPLTPKQMQDIFQTLKSKEQERKKQKKRKKTGIENGFLMPDYIPGSEPDHIPWK